MFDVQKPFQDGPKLTDDQQEKEFAKAKGALGGELKKAAS
jgi:hypothetical protein